MRVLSASVSAVHHGPLDIPLASASFLWKMNAESRTTSFGRYPRETGSTQGRVLRWLVAGFVLLAGLAAVLVGYLMLNRPDVAVLAAESPETTAFIQRYRQQQRDAGEVDDVAWSWMPAALISPHLKRAVVVAEDIEFFSHHGFSTTEIRSAIQQAIEDRTTPRGASTITQQLAKNLWLSPSRNPLRKLREAMLTRELEKRLSKDRILELYLNVVEFGPGVYGAEAAAQHYFGRSAATLTEHEAALLAATLPRPSRWNPSVALPGYRRYVAEIETRMDRATFIWRWIGEVPPPRLELDTFGLRDVNGFTDGVTDPPVGDSGTAAPGTWDSASVVSRRATPK